MKEKIIPFIKKYPLSILLAIIAFNLFSIAGSLKENAKRNQIELLCSVVASIKELPEEKGDILNSRETERILEVFKKIEPLVGYDLKYGVDAGDVCMRLKQY